MNLLVVRVRQAQRQQGQGHQGQQRNEEQFEPIIRNLLEQAGFLVVKQIPFFPFDNHLMMELVECWRPESPHFTCQLVSAQSHCKM